MAEAALSGLRVVECGSLVSAPYCGLLLAGLGAEVIKVEPPGGDPSRARGPFPPGHEGEPEASGLFLYLNANKKGLALDLATETGRDALLRLLGGADVLITSWQPGWARQRILDYASLARAFPGLVYTSITPFGLSGPRADWEATNLGVVSAGGWASITPGSSPWPHEPPLAAFGQQADFQAAATAAVATMGALLVRRRIGTGQLVDVSAQEVIASALELALVTYTYTGQVASRLGTRTSAPMEIMECADGLIFVMTADPHQWDGFVRIMGNPEWATWEVFSDRFKRADNRDALRPLIEDWLMAHTVQEVFDLAGEARLPFAPVSTIGDLVDSAHLKARGFFATLRTPGGSEFLAPGAPYMLPATPWALRAPAPRLGQHNAELLGAGVASR